MLIQKKGFFQRGVVNILALISLAVVTLALPFVTKLVQQRQETRVKANQCTNSGDCTGGTKRNAHWSCEPNSSDANGEGCVQQCNTGCHWVKKDDNKWDHCECDEPKKPEHKEGTACEEEYPAECTMEVENDGEKMCHKEGVWAKYDDGSWYCTWGAGSYCGDCVLDEETPVLPTLAPIPSITVTPSPSPTPDPNHCGGNCRHQYLSSCQSGEINVGQKDCGPDFVCCLSASNCGSYSHLDTRCVSSTTFKICINGHWQENDCANGWTCPSGGSQCVAPVATPTPTPTSTPTPTVSPTSVHHECSTVDDCQAHGRCNVGCYGWPRKCHWSPCPTSTPIPTSTPSCSDSCTASHQCKSWCQDSRYQCRGGYCQLPDPTAIPTLIPTPTSKPNYSCDGNVLLDNHHHPVETCQYGCSNGSCQTKPTGCTSAGTDYNHGASHCSTGSTQYQICENGGWLLRDCPSGTVCRDNRCRQPLPTITTVLTSTPIPTPVSSCDCIDGIYQGAKCDSWMVGRSCLTPTATPTAVPLPGYRCDGNVLTHHNQPVDTCEFGCNSQTTSCNPMPITLACIDLAEGDKRCSTNGWYVQECQGGRWKNLKHCADSGCSNASCVTICHPGETKCLSTKVSGTCNQNGTKWNTKDCNLTYCDSNAGLCAVVQPSSLDPREATCSEGYVQYSGEGGFPICVTPSELAARKKGEMGGLIIAGVAAAAPLAVAAAPAVAPYLAQTIAGTGILAAEYGPKIIQAGNTVQQVGLVSMAGGAALEIAGSGLQAIASLDEQASNLQAVGERVYSLGRTTVALGGLAYTGGLGIKFAGGVTTWYGYNQSAWQLPGDVQVTHFTTEEARDSILRDQKIRNDLGVSATQTLATGYRQRGVKGLAGSLAEAKNITGAGQRAYVVLGSPEEYSSPSSVGVKSYARATSSLLWPFGNANYTTKPKMTHYVSFEMPQSQLRVPFTRAVVGMNNLLYSPESIPLGDVVNLQSGPIFYP